MTSDPLLDELPHESDENHANCNCEAAKIYLAAGMETRRLGTKHNPSFHPHHQQPLPMPDMCMVERSVDKMVDDNISVERIDELEANSRPEIQQTSFITFKPAAIYGTVRIPDGGPVSGNRSPPACPRGLRADTLPIYGRLAGRDLYGTLPHRNGADGTNVRTSLAHIPIYEKRSHATTAGPGGCAECERELRVGSTYGPLPLIVDTSVGSPPGGVVAVVNDQVT